MTISFIDVYQAPSAAQTLYELLQSRSKAEAISHSGLPSLEQHLRFFDSKPYRYWYLVDVDGVIAGTLYLTEENTIGLSISEPFADERPAIIRKAIAEHEPLPAIPSKRIARFAMNVSPSNDSLIKDVITSGGDHVQNTYVFGLSE